MKPSLVLHVNQSERRVKEEMKAVARLYYQQEARIKADKKEKMSKYLESMADAAARTIQRMYYTFTVSKTPYSVEKCSHLQVFRRGLPCPRNIGK